jgi:phosphate:Na+ symporter
MVRFLEKRIQGAKETERLKPIYLNESALQFPDTALEVVLNETGHLFDNAFEIIAHGLNIHRHDILSNRPLETVVYKSRTPFELDVMQGYYDSIKVIYNSIVEFATRARVKGSLTDDQSLGLDSIRVVCRHIAQVIKNVSEMRENMVAALSSENEHISREYDLLRLRIVTILREIYRLRESKDEVEAFLTLTRLKEDTAEADVLANGTVDRLVRDGLIADHMATSLMNDSEFTHDISSRLIEIAERMFIAEGTDLKEIGGELLEVHARAS